MKQYQKIHYFSQVSKTQGVTKRPYQNIVFEKDQYNQYQNFLYKRALFGLSIYTPEELQVMHVAKKKRISKVHKRTQEILNSWKQELSHAITSAFLTKFFGKSSFVKEYSEKFAGVTDPEYISTTEFRELGITKDQIIAKLIREKILPHNFYEIKA